MSANVPLNGQTRQLDTPREPDEHVTDKQVGDAAQLTKLFMRILRDVADLKRRWWPNRIDFEDVSLGASGGKIRLPHNLSGRVRWRVVDYAERAGTTSTVDRVPPQSWVDRCLGVGTWTSDANNNTVGCRYRMKSVRAILGIRFGWQTVFAARTITCKIWNDSTGAVVASGTISVTNSGIYTLMFSTPITSDLTGVDITCSIYNAFHQSFTTDTSFWTSTPFELDDVLRAENIRLFSAGDARPTTNAVGGSYIVEPILDRTGGPILLKDSSTNEDVLVLRSYRDGVATIRVEEAG